MLVTSIPKIKGHRVCSVWLANIKSYRKWPWARDWHKSLWIENCIVFYWITLIKVSWEEAAVRSYLLVISMTVENIEGWKRCKRLFHYLLINELSVKPRFYSPCPPFLLVVRVLSGLYVNNLYLCLQAEFYTSRSFVWNSCICISSAFHEGSNLKWN